MRWDSTSGAITQVVAVRWVNEGCEVELHTPTKLWLTPFAKPTIPCRFCKGNRAYTDLSQVNKLGTFVAIDEGKVNQLSGGENENTGMANERDYGARCNRGKTTVAVYRVREKLHQDDRVKRRPRRGRLQ